MADWEHCLRLVKAADELRFRDPGRALSKARFACEAVAGVESESSDSVDWLLLQAEAWAVLGSAYRATGDFQRSENALNLAMSFLDSISEAEVEPLIWARLAQRASYLRCSQGRFTEALALNRDVLQIYDEQQDQQSGLAALVDRALVVARSGHLEGAISLLARCVEELDPDAQPRSYLAAVHNMAYYRLKAAQSQEEERLALDWLERARRLHHHQPAPLSLLQLRAMAATTAIRFGRRSLGVESLWQVYQGFDELEALSEQMLTLLHLADCAVEDGDENEVLRIAGLLFPLLGKTSLPDAARSALLRFLNAARSRSVTSDLVTRVADQLHLAVGS